MADNEIRELVHIFFSIAWYFDHQDEMEYPAQLELNDNNYELTIFHNGKVLRKIVGFIEKYTEIKGEIYAINSLDFRLDLLGNGNEYIRIPLFEYSRFTSYLDEIGKQKQENFASDILAKLPQLLNDADLIQITNNFLDDDYHFYLRPSYLIRLERLLERTDEVGCKLLYSSELERKNIITPPKKEDKGTFLSFVQDGFYPFSSFLKDRYNLPDKNVANYLTYIFLYRQVINYFFNKFSKEYAGHFPDIASLDLSGAIERYCTINTVNPKDLEVMGNFIYYLIALRKFETEFYYDCFDIFVKHLDVILDKIKTQNFIKRIKNSPTVKKWSIDDIDLMDGQEFEQFVAKMFSKMGYETEITKASGDQGIDVIASKDGNKIGIQAKCYSGAVSNAAVQEAVAGKNFYHLDKVMIITNSSFTASAQKLALANGVILWDRNILKEKITNYL